MARSLSIAVNTTFPPARSAEMAGERMQALEKDVMAMQALLEFNGMLLRTRPPVAKCAYAC